MTSGTGASRVQTLRPAVPALAGAAFRTPTAFEMPTRATLLPARSAPLVTPRPITLARSLTDRRAAEAPVLRRLPTGAPEQTAASSAGATPAASGPSASAPSAAPIATTQSSGSGQSLASESEDAAQQVTLLLGEREQILDLARAALRDGNEPLYLSWLAEAQTLESEAGAAAAQSQALAEQALQHWLAESGSPAEGAPAVPGQGAVTPQPPPVATSPTPSSPPAAPAAAQPGWAGKLQLTLPSYQALFPEGRAPINKEGLSVGIAFSPSTGLIGNWLTPSFGAALGLSHTSEHGFSASTSFAGQVSAGVSLYTWKLPGVTISLPLSIVWKPSVSTDFTKTQSPFDFSAGASGDFKLGKGFSLYGTVGAGEEANGKLPGTSTPAGPVPFIVGSLSLRRDF